MGFYTITNVGNARLNDNSTGVSLTKWGSQSQTTIASKPSNDLLNGCWMREVAYHRKTGLPLFVATDNRGQVQNFERADTDCIESFQVIADGEVQLKLLYSQAVHKWSGISERKLNDVKRWTDTGRHVLIASTYPDFEVLQAEESDELSECPNWGECRVICQENGEYTPVEDARSIFDTIFGYSCAGPSECTETQINCIPFDALLGCAARAHEICRLLCLDGIQAKKLFVDEVQSDRFCWSFHVAPVIQLKNGSTRVIDPVVSPDGPVSIGEWKYLMDYTGAHYVRRATRYIRNGFEIQDQACCTTWRTLSAIAAKQEKHRLLETIT
ncbi:MAG: protein-glutamine glutaminase family protein [Planctomycetota bacterium]